MIVTINVSLANVQIARFDMYHVDTIYHLLYQ